MTQVSGFMDHFKELRKRLLVSVLLLLIGFVISFYFANAIFDFLTRPLMYVLGNDESRRLIYTGLAEKFLTNVKVSAFSAFVVVFPLILCQIWLFIAPALYKDEKWVVLPLFILTPLLFVTGMYFVYTFVIPLAWEFFIGFEQMATADTLAVQLETRVSEYLSLTMQLMIAFGVVFEIPVFLILLVFSGICTSADLAKKRRYAILIAFVVAAVITPPDPISQLGLAIPMIFLYEISILITRFLVYNTKK